MAPVMTESGRPRVPTGSAMRPSTRSRSMDNRSSSSGVARPPAAYGTSPTMVLLYRPGAAWTADPYVLSPGRRSPLTLFAAEHFLGGISGYEAAETTDENPAAHVAVVRRVPLAHLRHTLGVDSTDWTAARRTLAGTAHPLGRLEAE